MKALLFVLMAISSTMLIAQTTIVWEGGAPGNQNNWDDSRNWSVHKVPDENSHVIIKQSNSGHHAQPIINEDVQVASVEIHNGAVLTIKENGYLLIDAEYTYSQGLLNYGGELINEGEIEIRNIDGEYGEGHVDAAAYKNTQPQNDVSAQIVQLSSWAREIGQTNLR